MAILVRSKQSSIIAITKEFTLKGGGLCPSMNTAASHVAASLRICAESQIGMLKFIAPNVKG